MAKSGLEVKLAGGQRIVGGYSIKTFVIGNLGTGSFVPNPLLGNYQYGTNNGAVQINAPTVDCAMDILITNTSTAGAVTFSGYTVGTTGDTITTTNGHNFIVSIRRINGVSTYLVKALQ